MSNGITSWSFSRWKTWHNCPLQAKFAYIEKIPQPQGPAAARGEYIHGLAEKFIKGEIKKLPDELMSHQDNFKDLKKFKVQTEHEICFTEGFGRPTTWRAKDCWVRMKVDAIHTVNLRGSGLVGRIIDYKTGRVYPEPARQQSDLYALGALLLGQHVNVRVEFWYLDISSDVMGEYKYEASDIEALKKKWLQRAKQLMTDTKFKAKPGDPCKWCAYAKKKGGPCKYG